MSTLVSGFQSFSGFLHNFVLAKLASNSIRVNSHLRLLIDLLIPTRANKGPTKAAVNCPNYPGNMFMMKASICLKTGFQKR